MNENIKLTINGIQTVVAAGTTVLKAAKDIGINIPTLCHLPELHAHGICRICVVQVEGRPNLLAACVLQVTEGMVIDTNTAQIHKARKTALELMLSAHRKDCLSCDRSMDCELQELANQFRVDAYRFETSICDETIDQSSRSIVRDNSKCILCRRCITVCQDVQDIHAIGIMERGFSSLVQPAFENLGDTICINCGQCIAVCPVNAIYERDDIENVRAAINDPTKHVVVQTAPAIRAALGETQGLPPGTLVTKKMVTALNLLGFDSVFDTNFSADLTIIEEGTELLTRLKKAIVDKDNTVSLPMTTSCSPGWVKYLEHYFPELTANVSTAKSPQQMMGTIIKTYYAKSKNIDPKDIVSVSIMPCTAKKYEAARPEMRASGFQDVDYVLTTRELGKIIREHTIDFVNLHDSEFDDPLGRSSGAADIFANSGGVTEAAIRTVYELVTGKELPMDGLHVTDLMDIKGIREASLLFENCLPEYSWLNGVTARVAATSGLGNAKVLMEDVKAGKSPYHLIEVMGCPGGCISGGGQPRRSTEEVKKLRFRAIIQEDEGKQLRKSHENPLIKTIYHDFLGTPNSHKAHELLHTHYTKRTVHD
ncbi:MAG: NADH-dependent [FeFe] hydrogenase, group A6 [Spirochaetaceae bacterium]